MSKLVIPRCEWCNRELRRTGARGPAPRYCNPACRMAASRTRSDAAFIRAELESEGVFLGPVVPAQRAPSAAADEQVARAYLEAKSLAGIFARLAVDARPEFAWRCAHVAKALSTAINETLGDG